MNKQKYMRNEIANGYLIILIFLMLFIPDVSFMATVLSVTAGFLFVWFREFQFDNNFNNPLNEAHLILTERYIKIFDDERKTPGTKFCMDIGKSQGSPDTREESLKIYGMLLALKDNIKHWPQDKSSRWLGYVQRYLTEQKLTTVQEERDFSRPLFQKAYKELGYIIPESIEIK